ncbi:hypothetical protein DXH95_15515 [Sphingorhabdus pulchriflava]|uniref:Uncharacterized protein n=1 Tax=Sphingorhabdus pulchriflava TaxID=2292257 RepID=A0A371B297_9SPHN|nr:tetratricopeptide repeat protein [Sphingorhabdus pulchriflava]RDV01688.1 hypothetical protein DXH95_15515 [Sphingorhabdus pulchriflava]
MKRTEMMLTIGLSSIVAGCSAFQPQAELNIRAVDSQQLTGDATNPLAEGRAKLAFGQNGLAISAFRAALREQPENAEAYNGLGIAYDRIGRKDLAQRYFELAVAGAPDNAKFNGNLARFFESSGRPHMAQGLSTPGIAAMREPQLNVAPQTSGALESKPALLQAVNEADTGTVLPATIAVPALAEVTSALDLDAKAEQPKRIEAVTVQDRPIASQLAIHRPASPVVIRAASIDPASLPAQSRNQRPLDEPMPFDVPRQPVAPAQHEGLRLERVSLGEVRLVTRPTNPEPKRKLANDFEGFGARLASWLPGEIAKEQDAPVTQMRKGPALKNAVAVAAIELAVADAEIIPQSTTKRDGFVYAFFDDDTIVHTSLAAL